MGHDISPIGNHNLNTKNIELLAKDIVSRIDINIEYGYFGRKEHFKILGEDRGDEFIEIGKITKDKAFKTYTLNDENYMLNQLYDKFGEAIFINSNYWLMNEGELPNKEVIIEEKKGLKYDNYSMDYESENEYDFLTINNEHYSNNIPYYSRWWSFCRFFIEDYYKDKEYLTSLNNFRKELMQLTFKLGGNKMYYLDDQSNILKGVGSGSEYELSWNELTSLLETKTSHLMLDIPKFLKNEEYQEYFLALNEYPLSFIDDYSDLLK